VSFILFVGGQCEEAGQFLVVISLCNSSHVDSAYYVANVTRRDANSGSFTQTAPGRYGTRLHASPQ
jgi:hypothetical protein